MLLGDDLAAEGDIALRRTGEPPLFIGISIFLLRGQVKRADDISLPVK